MITIYRLLTLVTLLSIYNVTWAWAESETEKYLSILDNEASSLYSDEKTVIKLSRQSQPEKVDRRLVSEQLSNGSFMAFMKNEYPASHRVYEQMPIHHKNQIFANYQIHLDINKSRQEMLKIIRNN